MLYTYEMNPCRRVKGDFEKCEDYSPDIATWSVYRRAVRGPDEGLAEWLSDHNTKEEAAAELEILPLVDAVECLLDQHSMNCVKRHETKEWTFYQDEFGEPLITEESCTCYPRVKEIRKLLSARRVSAKGFYPRKQR